MRIMIWYFVFLLTVVLSLPGCGNDDSDVHKEEHPESNHSEEVILSANSINEIGLQTMTISNQRFSTVLKIAASVKVNQDKEAQVGSLLQGRVHSVSVKVGDYVKAGQELMLVEGLEIGEIKAAYLTAKANLNFQKGNYERQKKLIEQKIGSQKSFLEAEAEYEKALAEFNAEDKKIHSIGLNDEDVASKDIEVHISGTLPIKSPIDGIVVERNVVIGQLVDGTTNAFRVINLSSVWVDGQVYEKDLNIIKNKTDVSFITGAYPEEHFSGRIIYIGQTIDEKTRTITIRAEFNNPKAKLKPQMFGDILIPGDENTEAVLVPVESIIKIGNEDFVFVQENDSTFIKRAVITGLTQDDLTEIKQGLNENETIVVKGGFSLKSELMKEELGEDEH